MGSFLVPHRVTGKLHIADGVSIRILSIDKRFRDRFKPSVLFRVRIGDTSFDNRMLSDDTFTGHLDLTLDP